MPCHDGLSDTEVLREFLDARTRMLCEVLTYIEASYPLSINTFTPEVQVWWQQHKELDKLRRLRGEK